MAKKKGLGRDIERSVELIDNLMEELKTFYGASIKRGLKTKGILDEDFTKNVDQAKEEAMKLYHKIENLKELIVKAKPKGNSRYACQNVVAKFLEIS